MKNKLKYSFFTLWMILISSPLRADDFTKVLEQFREMMLDPETGYLANQKAVHRNQVVTFMKLLDSDVIAFSYLVDLGSASLILLTEKLSKERADIEAELARHNDSVDDTSSIESLIQLSQRAKRLEADEAQIKFWMNNLLSDVATLIQISSEPCAASRLEFAKTSFNMKALFQRKGVQLDNFGKDAQSFFAEVFGGLLPDLGNQLPMHGGHAFAVGVNESGTVSLAGKLPFLSQTDSEIASWGTAAVSGVLMSKAIAYGGQQLGVATGQVMLAQLLGPQLAAQLISATSTAVMGVGIAIMAYTIGKMLYNGLNAFEEANKQRRILNEINNIIYQLPGQQESAQLVSEYCADFFPAKKDLVVQLSSLHENLLRRSIDLSVYKPEELSQKTWSKVLNKVHALPPIATADLKAKMRKNLELTEWSVGINSAWSRVVRQSMKSVVEIRKNRPVENQLTRMEDEIWLETQEILTSSLGRSADRTKEMLFNFRGELSK